MAFFSALWQDLRYGLRVLAKSPGVTLVALLSLALGIGAATAMFSVVYGVLISPYPYARPNEIWAPGIQNAKDPRQERSGHRLSEYREIQQLPGLASVMATAPSNQILTGSHTPENFTAVAVTANAFEFLGVPPVLGRTILPADQKPDGQTEPVIVLSYRAWQRLFDKSQSALGQKLVLNDQTYTVIGVMPPRFGWFTNDGGWLPLPTDSRDDRQVFAIMRLKPGVSAKAAEQQLHALHVRLAQEHPANFPRDGFRTVLHNYLDITVASGDMTSSLSLLFGAVGFLLLIACANVANLQLARATSRAREIALRMSIGAGRGRVLRQLLTESVLLSFAGGALGIALAIAITKATVALMPDYYVPNEARISVNSLALLFSVAVSMLTGILFGLVPALQCSRPNLVETLKDAAKGSGSRAAGGRTRSLLVIAEMALSVILLVGASLTIRGFFKLQQTELGFQPDRVMMVGLQLPPARYTTYQQRVAFTQDVLERVRNIPGARSAAIGNGGLPYVGAQTNFSIDGQPRNEAQSVKIALISADYGQTLGIPLLTGRSFSEAEISRAEPVALINEAATKLWPTGTSPIGSRMRLDILTKPPRAWLTPPAGGVPVVTIVGILGNTKNDGLKSPTAPTVFLPYTQFASTGRTVAVRAQSNDPKLLLNAIREQVRQIDKDLPLSRPITLEEVVGQEADQPRFNMALLSFFGGMGLVLAAVGIFSVLSFSVVRRTHEIGIRVALGAERRDVVALVMKMGARLVLVGLAAGLAGSFVLAKWLRSEVFDVPVTDPMAIAGVVALLCITAFCACLLPARRASRLQPMTALRHE